MYAELIANKWTWTCKRRGQWGEIKEETCPWVSDLFLKLSLSYTYISWTPNTHPSFMDAIHILDIITLFKYQTQLEMSHCIFGFIFDGRSVAVGGVF